MKLSILLLLSILAADAQIGLPLADDNAVTWGMHRHEVERAIKQKPLPSEKNELQYEIPLGIFRVVLSFDFVDTSLVRIRCTPAERENLAMAFKVWHLELKTKLGAPQPQIRNMSFGPIDNRDDYPPTWIVDMAANGRADFRFIWKQRETMVEQYIWARHQLLKTGVAYSSVDKAYALTKLDPL
jgi:hypothetical protein